jgi:hypothetical protein
MKKKRTPVTSFVAVHCPYWVWWLLYTVSPYHRGYDHGYKAAVKAYKVVAS